MGIENLLNMKKGFFFSLIIFLTTVVQAQSDVGKEELLSYQSPSEKFNDITLQAHNGLPRFGTLNNYLPVGQRPSRSSNTPEIPQKQALTRTGLMKYSIMLSLKFLEPLMKDLDTERLTTLSGNATETQKNSSYLQNFLRNQVAPNICTRDVCKNAGQGENEFERLRNYTSFVENCLAPLRKWSATFFENDELVAYHVSPISIRSNYDFDQKGYWVNHNLEANDFFHRKKSGGAKIVTFEPVAPYEHHLKNKLGRGLGLQFLLKLTEKAAEEYQVSGITTLYLVKKVRLNYVNKELINAQQPLNFNYSHVSPEITVYEDAALTQLVTKLSLENLILKTQ